MAPTRCKNCGIQFRTRNNGRPATYCNAGSRLMTVQNIRQVKARICRLEMVVRYYRDPTNLISADAAKRAAYAEIELVEARMLLRNLLH